MKRTTGLYNLVFKISTNTRIYERRTKMDVPKIVTQLSLEHLSIFLYCIIHGIIKYKAYAITIQMVNDIICCEENCENRLEELYKM